MFQDQLNARIAIKKLQLLSPLEKLALKIEQDKSTGNEIWIVNKAIDDFEKECTVKKFWSAAARAAAALARHYTHFRTTAAENKFGKFKGTAVEQSLQAHAIGSKINSKWGNGLNKEVKTNNLVEAARDHRHAMEQHSGAISQHRQHPSNIDASSIATHYAKMQNHAVAEKSFLTKAKEAGISPISDAKLETHIRNIAKLTSEHQKSGFSSKTRQALTTAYMNASREGVAKEYLHAAMHSRI